MKNLFYLFFFCLAMVPVHSQIGMKQWRMYISPNQAQDVVYGGGNVYCILEKGLIEYDIEKEEQTLWTVADYLSDASPSAIGFDNNSNSLIIGYDNGNIDILRNNRIDNIPFLHQSSVNGVKKVNRIVFYDGNAFLATGVGIVILNIQKKEIKDTYHPSYQEAEFLDIAVFQNKIYALTKDAIYVGHLSNNFLADPAQWTKLNSIPDYSTKGKYQELEVFKEQLFLSFRNEEIPESDTIFQIINGELKAVLDQELFYGINGTGDQFLVATYDGLYAYSNNFDLEQVIFNYVSKGSPHPRNAIELNGNYYIADREHGLVLAWDSYNTRYITFDGPRFNSAYRAKWLNDKLSIACGSMFGPNPAFSRKGGVIKKEDAWKSTVISEDSKLKDAASWDFICTSINPVNSDIVAYGSCSGIPLVLTENGKVVDTFTLSNSLIEEMSNTGWGYISDVSYDNEGNLWIANAKSGKPLKVLSKNGIWHDFNLGNEVKNKTTKRVLVDRNGVKWLAVKDAGLIAFDEGSDFENKTDDKYKLFNTGVSTGDLPSNDIEAIATDFDNNIWVGTPEGMRVLYNSNDFFDAAPGEYNFQKLLIEYGENVEIVLGTTHITSIMIDGDNRKWIGTASSGVFLLSPDGLDVEQNFTTENSPLLSNAILDIAINHKNGEVYFITEKGMITYRSDASQGDSEYSEVVVFPNPARPEHRGPITIQGIAYDSDVKITDVSGKLVYKTRSHGGTATWSGNTMDGNRASTGVYLIWTSIDDEDFKGRKVGKVLLIN